MFGGTLVYLSYFPVALLGAKVRVPIFIRHSTLRLPYRAVCPIIMIGPGTGVAPFRGFIQERAVTVNEGMFVALGLCILHHM